jgi:hypothetical protein
MRPKRIRARDHFDIATASIQRSDQARGDLLFTSGALVQFEQQVGRFN